MKTRENLTRRFRDQRRLLQRRNRRDAGYTLMELLVVMGILAVLTAVATPQLMGYFGKAKTQTVQLQIENIGTALRALLHGERLLSERKCRAEGIGGAHARGATVERSLSQEGQEPAGSLGASIPVRVSRFERRVRGLFTWPGRQGKFSVGSPVIGYPKRRKLADVEMNGSRRLRARRQSVSSRVKFEIALGNRLTGVGHLAADTGPTERCELDFGKTLPRHPKLRLRSNQTRRHPPGRC